MTFVRLLELKYRNGEERTQSVNNPLCPRSNSICISLSPSSSLLGCPDNDHATISLLCVEEEIKQEERHF